MTSVLLRGLVAGGLLGLTISLLLWTFISIWYSIPFIIVCMLSVFTLKHFLRYVNEWQSGEKKKGKSHAKQLTS